VEADDPATPVSGAPRGLAGIRARLIQARRRGRHRIAMLEIHRRFIRASSPSVLMERFVDRGREVAKTKMWRAYTLTEHLS
jgi:hypothetical protein